MKARLFNKAVSIAAASMLLLMAPIHAQSNCEQASVLPINGSCLTQQVSTTEEAWYSFTAIAPQVELNVFSLSCSGYIVSAELLTGGCSSHTTQVTAFNTNGVISLNYNNLAVGAIYWVRLNFSGTNPACYNICAENAVWDCKTTSTINGVVFLDCASPPPPPLVCKGDSVTITPWIQLGSSNSCDTPATWSITINPGNLVYSIADGSSLVILAPDNGTCEQNYSVVCVPICDNGDTACGYIKLCPNFTVICPPVASISFNPTPICLGDTITFFSDSNSVSANYTETLTWYIDGNFVLSGTADTTLTIPSPIFPMFLSAGQHSAALVISNGACFDSTSITFYVNNPNPCFTWSSSCRVSFLGDSVCAIGIASQYWNFGDGSPISTSTNPTHTFPLSGQAYTVTHTIITIEGDSLSCQATVIQQGGPVANIQGFAVNSCGNGSINYTANPCVPGIVYAWVATNGTPSMSVGCNTSISWDSLSGGMLVLVAWDSISDCYGYDTIIIPPCCSGTAAPTSVTYINNLTASQFIAAQNNNNVYSSTNQTIINGVFTVDADFTFLNCPDIWMGPNAAIIVQPGRTLTINNSKVIGKCQYMWDGIYIQDATATLNVINNSVIEQAKQAIVSINGGNFQVENSKLLNNLKGIIVQAHQGQHAGAIRGSTIAMPGTFLPAIPALPWWQTKTLVGIEIESNASITIGDASQAAYRNTFRHMFNAIWSKQSNTTVVNAKIARLSNHLNATNSGEGIVSEGGKQVSNPPYFYQLTVGGFGLNDAVTTDSTRIGIETRFTQRVYIYKNNIRNTRFYGIFVRANNAGTVQILNNGISNQTGYGFAMNTGIVVLDCYRAFVDISNNNLNQQNASVSTQIGTGIRVGNVLPGIVYLNISNNAQIRRYQTGIWLQNLDGKNTVFVNYNNIQFSKSKSDYTVLHRGIRLENCISVRVDHNLVQRLGANWLTTEQNFASNLRGISVENSPGSLVYQNDCKRVGDGITGFGSCPASTFACNDLWRCYNGFNFFNADIGDQVIDPNTAQPAPTGNVYTSSVNRDLTGAISPAVNWYESAGINEQMQAGSLVPIAINDPQIISTVNLCGTIYQIAPPPVTERSVEAGNVILSLQANNNILSLEQQHLKRKYVHRKLRQNPQWLTLGTPQDSIYQSFYIQADSTNLGLFRVVEENAIVENQPQVEAVNSSIACYGVMDHNLKVVTEIYSRTWMENIFEFSSNDSLMLYVIAILDPNIDGPGVYSARALLGLQVDDVTGNAAFRLSDERDLSAPLGAIHPNPAIETVSLAMNLNQDEIGELEIYDINGRLIRNQGVSGAMELITLDVSSLDAGTYIVRLSVNGELRINERLVIVK